jgi:hypothetical protein
MNKILFITFTLLLNFTGSLVAEDFTVSANVTCPANTTTPQVNGATIANTNYQVNSSHPLKNNFKYVNCSGLRVTAMNANKFYPDEYCGAGYTDSKGDVNFSASCGNSIDSPDVYLKS